MMYEYRVCYKLPEGLPSIWMAHLETLGQAREWVELAREEGRWGEIWIEKRSVTEWEEVGLQW